jgi:hypothetical protein
MKRATMLLIVAFCIALPAFARAQYGYFDEDRLDPYEYRDVDDAQILKLLSYVGMPVGMALEWGITRPLHYAATQTPLEPLLSGDVTYNQFGQNDNASLLPPETFAPQPLNFSNHYVTGPPEREVRPAPISESVIPPARNETQSTIH